MCYKPGCKICYQRTYAKAKKEGVPIIYPPRGLPGTSLADNHVALYGTFKGSPVFLEVIDSTNMGLKIDIHKIGRTARVMISMEQQSMNVHKVELRAIKEISGLNKELTE